MTHVQFSDASKTRIVAIFAGPQDANDHPNQGVVGEGDERLDSFLNPPRIPASVSRFQARAALYQAGHFEAVEAFMARPDTPMLAKLAWQDAQAFERPSATVAMLAAALGLTDADLDALFIAGDAITA